MMRVYVTTNSPGEVATWVRPIVSQLHAVRERTGQHIEVYVFVTPCRYATGHEAQVLAALPAVKRVFSTRETAQYAIAGKLPPNFQAEGPGMLLFLGGEMKLAAWLARRLHVPAFVYTEGFLNSAKAFQRVYVPYERGRQRALQHGARDDQVRVVGNLMVDAAIGTGHLSEQKVRQALLLDERDPVVTFFPGSRKFEWQVLMPFYSKVLSQLRQHLPNLQAVFAISPFAVDIYSHYEWQIQPDVPQITTLYDEEIVVVSGQSTTAILAADLVLTLPGSNTVEIAALGRAMVVSLPLYYPEDVPLDGLVGMIGRIPLIGRPLKRFAVRQYSKKTKFAALPNMLVQKEIAPELRGENLQPRQVTTVAYKLLMDDDRRESVRMQLQDIVGEYGAAERIISDMLQYVRRS